MTDSYKVGYSVDALDDLREFYSYIANELLVTETATAQLSSIRKEFRCHSHHTELYLAAAQDFVQPYEQPHGRQN